MEHEKKLQIVEDSMRPIVIALDDYLSEIQSEDSEDQPQIQREADDLYRNLKSFLGSLHLHKILTDTE